MQYESRLRRGMSVGAGTSRGELRDEAGCGKTFQVAKF